MSRDILSAIQSGMAGFSKGQKLIARYKIGRAHV